MNPVVKEVQAAALNGVDMRKLLPFLLLALLAAPAVSDPLHDAVEDGTVEQAQRLIERGANLNARDHEGESPLHEAAEAGRLEMVKMLVEAGARRGPRDDEGETPLHEAAEEGHLDVVRFLVLHGAPFDTLVKEGRSALLLAIV